MFVIVVASAATTSTATALVKSFLEGRPQFRAFFGVMPAFFTVAAHTTSVHFVSGCDKNYQTAPQFFTKN